MNILARTKKTECRRIVSEYVEQHNPYEKKPKLGYNIAEKSRYAAKQDRKVSELTQEEAAMFVVK